MTRMQYEMLVNAAMAIRSGAEVLVSIVVSMDPELDKLPELASREPRQPTFLGEVE